MMDRNHKEIQVRLHKTITVYCRRYIIDPQSRDACAIEFVEHILLFLNTEKRDVLLADGNKGLLHRAAFCFVLNWTRKARLHQSHAVHFTDLPESMRSMLVDSNAEVFAKAMRVFAADSLHGAINRLPLKQRQCASRCWLEDQSVAEIAADLNLTPASVRKNLQYAREAVQARLNEMEIEKRDLL